MKHLRTNMAVEVKADVAAIIRAVALLILMLRM